MLQKLIWVLLIGSLSITQAQVKTITGTVYDESGPLPGVTIKLKGSDRATETDFDGKYSIQAQKGDVLIFTFIGVKAEERTVSESVIINVTMITDDTLLDEVVVSCLSTKKRRTSYESKVDISASVEYTKPQSGQLTAGEINDIDKWKDWIELTKDSEFSIVKDEWGFQLTDKVEVFVKDDTNHPINNTIVTLSNQEGLLQKVKTDVFGKAILFTNTSNFYTIQAIYNNDIKGLNINKNHRSVTFTFSNNRKLNNIDVMFTIDATGSMGDEINYLKSEIENIISRIDTSILQKRVALTFYRDHGDEYVVKDYDFTTDINTVKTNLSNQYASGGGDYEEAVEEALRVSLSKNWSKDAKSKLLFLLLDAPPHLTSKNISRIKTEIKKAQELGIKIIPIVASGANKTLEYLMRLFSVSTNGTYVFLSDDSGIGNPHLKPSADDLKIEKLNDLIVRLIEKYAGV